MQGPEGSRLPEMRQGTGAKDAQMDLKHLAKSLRLTGKTAQTP